MEAHLQQKNSWSKMMQDDRKASRGYSQQTRGTYFFVMTWILSVSRCRRASDSSCFTRRSSNIASSCSRDSLVCSSSWACSASTWRDSVWLSWRYCCSPATMASRSFLPRRLHQQSPAAEDSWSTRAVSQGQWLGRC